MREKGEYLFTSESVSEGHPDKVADRISDTVLDAFLTADPYARVACETLVTTNRIVLAGETRGPESVTAGMLEELVRAAVKDIGYDQEGFSWRNAAFECHLHAQSADIAVGVDAAGNKDEGAGDQGIMFGYATNETPELMPAPLTYAHNILRVMAELRHAGDKRARGLQPDAKSQVTLRYVDGKPVGVTCVVISTQHDEGLEQAEIKELLRPIVRDVLPAGWEVPEAEFYVNPTGKFVIGGPDGDAGLTGARSSSTPMAARPRMAAAPSAARTRPRSTAPPPMPPATWRRTSSRPASPTAAPSRSPMPSACPSRSRSISTCTAPGMTWTR
jgi:S-adenosylmethionine synthetase